MFKLPNLPSLHADISETADFAEIECLKNPGLTASLAHIVNIIKREQENDHSDTEDEDARVEQDAEEALIEIERRMRDSGGPRFYPFVVDRHGTSVEIPATPLTDLHWLYVYLLLATRLNMRDAARAADIDGALLFEEVAAWAAASYLGPGTGLMVFGTASNVGSFTARVEELCRHMGEGGAFQARDQVEEKRRDGALDLVVWKDFADRRMGKLIGFGQCKTGTEWTGTLTALQPVDFFAKWTRDQAAVDPVRMFFVAESLSTDRWYEYCRDGGILFDRCRVLSHGQALPAELLARVKAWTRAAAKDQLGANLN